MLLNFVLALLLLGAPQQQAPSPSTQRPAPTAAPRASGAAPEAPPAPAAGSPGTYKAGADFMAVLKKAAAMNLDLAVAEVSNTDQYRINVGHRGKAMGAVVHPGNTEIHYVIEGAGMIVTGGTIVQPIAADGTATIQNGETRRMTKGDLIVIPPNTPHWYKDVEGSITYLEVRFIAPR